KIKDIVTLCHGGREWPCDSKSYVDGGVLGGGTTSFYDLSITKNVVTMFIVFFLLGWLLIGAARKYARREGMAPSGVQGLLETMFVFIQDEVIKPFLGDKWEKYTPFLMSLFFFVLGLNLFGQVPFFGGSNVTGNLSFTLVIAVLAFLVTNFSGNKHYWQHIFWMPGIPAWVKTVVTPVEIMGLFIKPITLTLRLFGNIVAGHMVVVIFVGLIFMFGKNGENVGAGLGAAVGSTLLTMFMMAIELLVAFIQAFVFTILTASYIGAATEEHHHEEAH
ncbi:MAG TPA: ATP synthase F0 subunit A, partial [Saprospiraceae bacterium]|nr:ATP synthase F0 subunit A [Saprospiraceae bacterium]